MSRRVETGFAFFELADLSSLPLPSSVPPSFGILDPVLLFTEPIVLLISIWVGRRRIGASLPPSKLADFFRSPAGINRLRHSLPPFRRLPGRLPARSRMERWSG